MLGHEGLAETRDHRAGTLPAQGLQPFEQVLVTDQGVQGQARLPRQGLHLAHLATPALVTAIGMAFTAVRGLGAIGHQHGIGLRRQLDRRPAIAADDLQPVQRLRRQPETPRQHGMRQGLAAHRHQVFRAGPRQPGIEGRALGADPVRQFRGRRPRQGGAEPLRQVRGLAVHIAPQRQFRNHCAIIGEPHPGVQQATRRHTDRLAL